MAKVTYSLSGNPLQDVVLDEETGIYTDSNGNPVVDKRLTRLKSIIKARNIMGIRRSSPGKSTPSGGLRQELQEAQKINYDRRMEAKIDPYQILLQWGKSQYGWALPQQAINWVGSLSAWVPFAHPHKTSDGKVGYSLTMKEFGTWLDVMEKKDPVATAPYRKAYNEYMDAAKNEVQTMEDVRHVMVPTPEGTRKPVFSSETSVNLPELLRPTRGFAPDKMDLAVQRGTDWLLGQIGLPAGERLATWSGLADPSQRQGTTDQQMRGKIIRENLVYLQEIARRAKVAFEDETGSREAWLAAETEVSKWANKHRGWLTQEDLSYPSTYAESEATTASAEEKARYAALTPKQREEENQEMLDQVKKGLFGIAPKVMTEDEKKADEERRAQIDIDMAQKVKEQRKLQAKYASDDTPLLYSGSGRPFQYMGTWTAGQVRQLDKDRDKAAKAMRNQVRATTGKSTYGLSTDKLIELGGDAGEKYKKLQDQYEYITERFPEVIPEY